MHIFWAEGYVQILKNIYIWWKDLTFYYMILIGLYIKPVL